MTNWKQRRIALFVAIIVLSLSAACAGSTMYVGVAAPGPWYGGPVPYGGGVMVGRPVW